MKKILTLALLICSASYLVGQCPTTLNFSQDTSCEVFATTLPPGNGWGTIVSTKVDGLTQNGTIWSGNLSAQDDFYEIIYTLSSGLTKTCPWGVQVNYPQPVLDLPDTMTVVIPCNQQSIVLKADSLGVTGNLLCGRYVTYGEMQVNGNSNWVTSYTVTNNMIGQTLDIQAKFHISNGAADQNFSMHIGVIGGNLTGAIDPNTGYVPTCTTPGLINTMVTGGTPPYTYQWSSNATPIGNGSTANYTSAGLYSVTVTDSKGCSATHMPCELQAGSGGPSVSISTVPNTSCGNQPNGSAQANVTAGVGPYTYVWSSNTGGQTTQTASNLPAGNYSVTVTDANGCKTIASCTVIDNSSSISIVITNKVDVSCTTLGSITVNATGGKSPYTYSWSNGVTGQTNSNLNAGNFSVTVVDANKCSSVTSCEIKNTGSITGATISPNGPLPCVGSSQFVTMTFVGPGFPYQVAWTPLGSTGIAGSFIYTNFGNTFPLYNGTYHFIVTKGGCSYDFNYTFGNPPIVVTVVLGTTSCNGTMSATATATGGSGFYTYKWSDGQTGPTATLTTGNYSVTATDALWCTGVGYTSCGTSQSLTASVVTTPAECGNNNGTATVQVSPSNGQYTFKWSTGATTQTILGLGAGTYSVVVTNILNQCTTYATGEVKASGAISVTVIPTGGNCSNSGTILPSGGQAPYFITVDGIATGQAYNSLQPGSHLVEVSDASGCKTSKSFEVGEAPIVTFAALSPTYCGNKNGYVQINVNYLVVLSQFNVKWSNGLFPEQQWQEDLPSGNYSVTVTTTGGCSTVKDFQINDSKPFIPYIIHKIDNSGDHTGGATLISSLTSGTTDPWELTITSMNQSNNNYYHFEKAAYNGIMTVYGIPPGMYGLHYFQSGCPVDEWFNVTYDVNLAYLHITNANANCQGGSIQATFGGLLTQPVEIDWYLNGSYVTTTSGLSAVFNTPAGHVTAKVYDHYYDPNQWTLAAVHEYDVFCGSNPVATTEVLSDKDSYDFKAYSPEQGYIHISVSESETTLPTEITVADLGGQIIARKLWDSSFENQILVNTHDLQMVIVSLKVNGTIISKKVMLYRS